MPTLRLHFFGAVVRVDEFFVVLLGVLFLAFFFIWITIAFGRIWCGWLCPQTLLVDLTGPEGRGGRQKRGPAVQVRILVVSVLAGAVSVWYFVSPYDFMPALFARSLGPVAFWSWIVLSALTWLNLQFVRYTFCATVCPYSRFQGVMFDRHTMAIAFDARRRGECIDCAACVKACPVNIDIRDGLQAACVSCTECIDTCARIMEKKRKKSLVGFFFGEPGGDARLLRPGAIIPLAAAAVFLVLFLVSLTGREGIEANLLPRHDVPPRLSASGRIVNSFELSIENRGGEKATFTIAFPESSAGLRLTPQRLTLRADEHRRVPVVISAAAPGPVAIIIRGGDGPPVRLSATILSPERK